MTAAAEVDVSLEALEETARRESPPCEARSLGRWEVWKRAAFRHGGNAGHPCRRPSAFRVSVACRACGARYRLFLCKRDASVWKSGRRVLCRACGRTGVCRATES
jgi:hypothetical protein